MHNGKTIRKRKREEVFEVIMDENFPKLISVRYHYTSIKMAKAWNSDNIKC